MMIPQPEDDWDFATKFVERHRQEFGFTMPRAVYIGDVRVRAVGKSSPGTIIWPAEELKTLKSQSVSTDAVEVVKKVYFENIGWQPTPIYLLSSLVPGDQIHGPAMIIDNKQTILIIPDATTIALRKHIVIHIGAKAVLPRQPAHVVDPVQLSVFGHCFTGIAEEMSRTLQKTSVSTNIKERLDFCALFSEDGRLVANASHVPVHLRSMQYAVLRQHEHWKEKLKEGTCLCRTIPVSIHCPSRELGESCIAVQFQIRKLMRTVCGGTHLPDITVITPCFHDGKIVFYVASRGHHADIGGISAGSLPPHSTELWQEGAAIKSVKLVQDGVFDEEAMRTPARAPGQIFWVQWCAELVR